MKIVKFVLAFLVGIAVGYLVRSSFSVGGVNLSPIKSGISGDAVLEVKLVMDNNVPLPNVEVDLAEKLGPPPEGGVSLTDENGIAKFNVKPGSYFIYFNQNNFPGNIEIPQPQGVEVKSGIDNAKTVIMKTKK